MYIAPLKDYFNW